MSILQRLAMFIFAIAFLPGSVHAADLPEYRLKVAIHPERNRLEVEADISGPWQDSVEFWLNKGLKIVDSNAEIETLSVGDGSSPSGYRAHLPDGERRLILSYRGVPTSVQNKGDVMPSAVFGDQGVYVDGGSYWYPSIGSRLMRFDLEVDAPSDWTSISQGVRSKEKKRQRWVSSDAQDDIYLLSAPWYCNGEQTGSIRTEVCLYEESEELSQRYLGVTGHYLKLYEELIGPYPYEQFIVVENQWQTGYGMPGFTLLGSRVLRLPFILHSSYPHELLHNWWGNSVWIDIEQGNWAEGLTTYLADHLIKAQRGGGEQHRRSALQRYTRYSQADEIPLQAFRRRTDGPSQAIGYDKSMMLFHMLRQRLGDEQFRQGLRHLYQTQRFKLTGWKEIQARFEEVSGEQLGEFFNTWLSRPYAPEITLGETEVSQAADGSWNVSFALSQQAPTWPLQIPVSVQGTDGSVLLQKTVALDTENQRYQFSLAGQPARLNIDPHYDVMRRLLPGELPASLASLFSAKQQLLLIPTQADSKRLQAWQMLARTWQKRWPNVKVLNDSALDELPADSAVWVLGESNRFAENGGNNPQDSYVHLKERSDLPPLGFISSPSREAIYALARKLPHYGRYGELRFEGPEAKNTLKKALQPSASPLSKQLGKTQVAGPKARQDKLAAANHQSKP